jgi:hypothetical protein
MTTPDESITTEPRPAPPATNVAEDAPIPLPPVEKPPEIQDDPDLRRRLAWLDAGLWGLVLVLAFLLGSFAATNSDVWMHLALGRDLLAGTYHFGVDPYSFTTEGIYWVNHSWLFDVLLYGLYSLAGGAVVVIVKALAVAGMAWLLGTLRRADQSAWLPLCVVALALLVMSPRLVLQPTIVSFLLLAVTLFVLVRTSPRDGVAPVQVSLWWLVPLFVLWVNSDHWFWLGPLTVGLFALGEWLQDRFPIDDRAGKLPPGRLKTLGLVFVAGLLACVVNPHHVYVFTLPAELAQLVAGLPLPADFIAEGLAINRFVEHDPQSPVRFFWISPVTSDYFRDRFLGKTVAGLAYFPLLAMGLASILLSLRVGALRYWRLLLWAVLALLSLLQSRLIPFFAVAAVPVTVLNLQDFATRWTAGDLRVQRGWSLGGRLVTGLLLLALAALAWPGWLNPTGPEATLLTLRSPRRVAWQVDEDPSLKQAALALAELQKRGGLKNGFNFAPEFGFYAAWFAPGVKDYYDARFALFADQAETIGKVRRDFQDETKGFFTKGTLREKEHWRRVFREKQVNYLVVSNTNEELARRFLFDTKDWAPFYDDGRTAIFGWRGPQGAEKFAGMPEPLRRDALAAAFGPTPADGPPVPSEVEAPQQTWYWWDYLYGQPKTPLATDAAKQHLFTFQLTSGQFATGGNTVLAARRWHEVTLQKHLFGTPWVFGPWLGPELARGTGMAAALDLAAILVSPTYYDDLIAPAAHAYLAVRAARRGLSENPNDAASYFALAQACATLGELEDAWRESDDVWRYPPLRQKQVTDFSLMELRQIQILAALNFTLDLYPDHIAARGLLRDLYLRSNQWDAALEQMSEFRQAVERLRAEGKVTDPKQFEQQQKGLEQQYKMLAAEVNNRRSSYLLQADRLDPAGKYRAAMSEPYRFQGPKGEPMQDPRGRGLVLEALKALRTADRSKLKDEQREVMDAMQVDLLLRMGKFRELAEMPTSTHVLQATDSSPRLLGLYLPAVGNYAEADKVLEIADQRYGRDDKAFARLAGEALGNMLLASQTNTSWLQRILEVYANRPREQLFMVKLNELRASVKRRADLLLLRGVLALEQGDTDKALVRLRDCLRLTDLGDSFEARRAADATFPDRGVARRLVRLLEAQRPAQKGP